MGFWDAVVIGEGNKGCSAVLVYKIQGEHGISENSVSYWISDAYLDMGMTIFKNTPEGEFLRSLINQGDLPQIQVYLADLFLKHVDPQILRKGVDKALKNAFREGRRSKAAEIKNSLNSD